jgi:hypothetical protein
MAHYAFLDDNNIVTEVITGRNEWEVVDGITDWESHYSHFRGQRCLRTSLSGTIRKTFARVGSRYDEATDSFILPQPFASWELDSDLDWVAPIPYPDDDSHIYRWDEETRTWIVSHNWNDEDEQWIPV